MGLAFKDKLLCIEVTKSNITKKRRFNELVGCFVTLKLVTILHEGL